jgi:hypothetical protein
LKIVWCIPRERNLASVTEFVEPGADSYEYGIVYLRAPNEPHRAGMTKSEADKWIAEWRQDGGRDVFRVIRRWLGPWELLGEITVDDRDIETIVFESLGEVSTCWDPSTGDAVFDSTRARAIGDRLLAEIRARIVGDRSDELIAERNRLRDDVVGLRMLLAEATAERDQIQDERDVFRDQALPEAATIMNGLSAALAEANAERDQLRAIVRGAQEWSEAHRVWMNQAKGEGVQPTDEASRHQAATAAAMLDLIDHLDPPDGDGGATIELLAAMYGCVRDLIAERDRLRSIVDIVRDAFLRPSDDEWKIDSGALVVLADALNALDGSEEATDG